MEEFLDFIKEPRFIHRTCLSLHWWPIGWQIFPRNGIYFSARYSCLCCVLWILFGDKGKCRQKILVFLKWKKKLKNEKGDIFISWKNELKKLDFNDWNSSLIAGGFAGPFFWLAGLPGDTLKSKWQTDLNGEYKSLRDVFMRTNTIKQLYKGFKPVMARDLKI